MPRVVDAHQFLSELQQHILCSVLKHHCHLVFVNQKMCAFPLEALSGRSSERIVREFHFGDFKFCVYLQIENTLIVIN